MVFVHRNNHLAAVEKVKSINMAISQVIKERRKQQRYSQEMLAEGSGLHATTISRIETGVHSPKVENVYQICVFLKISLTDFFAEVEKKVPKE